MDRIVEDIALVPTITLDKDEEISNTTKLHQTSDNFQQHFLSRLFKSKKHLKAFLLWIVSFICLIIVAGPLSLHISSALPTVKTRNVASHIFSEERARDYLNNLTQYGPRVSHTRGNYDAQHFLITQIKRIVSKSKRHLRFEVELQNLTDPNHHQLQNILVRVSNPTKTLRNTPSLMLSAHYDSVEFSPGGCDDGSGVVVLLELLSNLINDLTMTFSDVDLIVLLTNAEEMGSDGAQSFITNHTWRSNIRRFICIDGASCKARASLVRLKPSKLIIDYNEVPRPSSNVIMDDVLQKLGFRADYDTNILNGSLIGYELGFLVDGYTYHTTLDDLSNVKQGVLQDLGDNLGVLIRHILVNDIEKAINMVDSDPLIYFDIYSRYLIVYKMSTSIIIEQVLIVSILIVGLMLIILDDLYHHRQSLVCIDCHCIYYHFKHSFVVRVLSIIFYLIFYLFSILVGVLFSLIISLLMSMIEPLSWFGNSTLAIFIFSFPCLIGFITSGYLCDVFHRFLLRKFGKTSPNPPVDIDHFDDIHFDFERNMSLLLVYSLLMIISIYSHNKLFYIVLIWSIFICPIYLLVMIIEFVIHWKKIRWNLFEERNYWLYLPLIICLFPLTHTIEITNRLIRFLIPLLTKRFSFGLWPFYGNLIICSIIAIPTVFFALIFLPILQRTKYFCRTLVVLLISLFVILFVGCVRQPFNKIHPNIFYAKHTSQSMFTVETLFNVSSYASLQSQSSSIMVISYDGLALSPVLDRFSAKSGHILRKKQCFRPTNCRFDDTFNRTMAVEHIEMKSMKNLNNYTILIHHVLSYKIEVFSNSSIKLNVRNKLVVPRTETIIDVTLNSRLWFFDIHINIKRCDINDSPFLLLFTRLMPNMVLIGRGQCQAIDDDTTLIITRQKIV